MYVMFLVSARRSPVESYVHHSIGKGKNSWAVDLQGVISSVNVC